MRVCIWGRRRWVVAARMITFAGTWEANIVPVVVLEVEVAVLSSQRVGATGTSVVPSSPGIIVKGVAATETSAVSVWRVRITAWRSITLKPTEVVEPGSSGDTSRSVALNKGRMVYVCLLS
jgi:hypothetical protein